MITCDWEYLIGTVIDGKYRLRTLTYSGSDQAEFIATGLDQDASLSQVALTLVAPAPALLDEMEAEMRASSRLEHPNLLKIAGVGRYTLSGITLLYLAAEAPDASLADCLTTGPCSEAETRQLVEDVLAGLTFVHAGGLVYRSLEPQTTVRAGGRWKLADLGRLHPAGEAKEPLPASVVNSPYTPPEASSGVILPAWDMWSLGKLIRIALTGMLDGNGNLPAPYDRLVAGCLVEDPSRRLTLREADILLRTGLEDRPPQPARKAPEAESVPVFHPASEVNWAPSPEPAPHRPFRKWIVAGASAVLLLLVVFSTSWWLGQRPEEAVVKPKANNSQPPVPDMGTPATRPSPMADDSASAVRQPPPFVALREERSRKAGSPARGADLSLADATSSADRQVDGVGTADYSGTELDGNRTASGESFDSKSLTAAHPTFPIGTQVRVTNLRNDREVVVRINDRTTLPEGHVIRLTIGAARELGFAGAGRARVRIERVE
ncbi:MAG: septal ring lytic transglycosylase RlpA family protein [Bryobacteraceae bacterium]|nr:septal ring lytic transglycosylase RlpA family protein [Bryobacterales bacterium]MEB2362912.1 septal ring lytic transglycosylase RlpA family protein [Bryobacterales bacterium]NUN03866.1 septal ring lytic transglycosylase RlpA family protein [Bryobacteraceae bacterium]